MCSIGQLEYRTVGELPAVRAGGIYAKHSLKSYPTQHNDDFRLKKLYFTLEERLAIVEFFGGGFVAGRSAATGGGDVHVAQFQPVVTRERIGLAGKSRAEQSRIEESARCVSGELSPRPVRAVRTGGESHHEDARMRVAKSGHGFAPVVMVTIGFAFFARHLLAPLHQARTRATGYNLRIQFFKCHESILTGVQG